MNTQLLLERSYPANTPGVLAFLGDLEQLIEKQGWPMDTGNHWALMGEEIATNIAKYAYPDAPESAEFHAKLHLEGNQVILQFEDEGVPYNPIEEEDPDRTGPIEDMPIGGLGVFLVKQMADELKYERRDQKNWLKIGKTLSLDKQDS